MVEEDFMDKMEENVDDFDHPDIVEDNASKKEEENDEE